MTDADPRPDFAALLDAYVKLIIRAQIDTRDDSLGAQMDIAFAAVVAEVDRIRSLGADWSARCIVLEHELAAEQDAARYRWLRDNATVLIPEALVPGALPDDDWTPEQLDAAIDAATARKDSDGK